MVLHHTGSSVEHRAGRDRSRGRTPDVPAADGARRAGRARRRAPLGRGRKPAADEDRGCQMGCAGWNWSGLCGAGIAHDRQESRVLVAAVAGPHDRRSAAVTHRPSHPRRAIDCRRRTSGRDRSVAGGGARQFQGAVFSRPRAVQPGQVGRVDRTARRLRPHLAATLPSGPALAGAIGRRGDRRANDDGPCPGEAPAVARSGRTVQVDPGNWTGRTRTRTGCSETRSFSRAGTAKPPSRTGSICSSVRTMS